MQPYSGWICCSHSVVSLILPGHVSCLQLAQITPLLLLSSGSPPCIFSSTLLQMTAVPLLVSSLSYTVLSCYSSSWALSSSDVSLNSPSLAPLAQILAPTAFSQTSVFLSPDLFFRSAVLSTCPSFATTHPPVFSAVSMPPINPVLSAGTHKRVHLSPWSPGYVLSASPLIFQSSGLFGSISP